MCIAQELVQIGGSICEWQGMYIHTYSLHMIIIWTNGIHMFYEDN